MHTDNDWYHWPGFQENMNKICRRCVTNTEKGTFQWRISPEDGSTAETGCGADTEEKISAGIIFILGPFAQPKPW